MLVVLLEISSSVGDLGLVGGVGELVLVWVYSCVYDMNGFGLLLMMIWCRVG